MDVTSWTWVVAVAGMALMGLLGAMELIALVRPRERWTIDNVYGGDPDATDPTAYFAFNRGLAWADVVFWAPLQFAGSIAMLAGQRWGFALALMASVPFWYTAIPIFVWDKDLGFRQNTLTYWVIVWGMFPAYGVIEGLYCLIRLLD